MPLLLHLSQVRFPVHFALAIRHAVEAVSIDNWLQLYNYRCVPSQAVEGRRAVGFDCVCQSNT